MQPMPQERSNRPEGTSLDSYCREPFAVSGYILVRSPSRVALRRADRSEDPSHLVRVVGMVD